MKENGTQVPVSSSETIQGSSDQFTFVIDASDQVGQNLLTWNLLANWGFQSG